MQIGTMSDRIELLRLSNIMSERCWKRYRASEDDKHLRDAEFWQDKAREMCGPPRILGY